MRLVIITPLASIVDTETVTHVRAEDPSGAFGILAGHGDFLTNLTVSVLTWRDNQGRQHHIAVRGGVLSVRDGSNVLIATPEAIADDDLHQLESEVLMRFRQQLEAERAAHTEAQRLHLAAIRQIMRLLRPESSHAIRPG